MIRILAIAVLAAGCSAATSEPDGIRLTATLATPVDVELRWDGAPKNAGAVVEFATEEAGRYTILEFLAPGRRTYEHPDLMPRTPFYYRIRPVLGQVSATVDAAAPGGVSTVADSALVPRAEGSPSASHRPVGEPGAAPADLGAEVIASDAIRLKWTDNAEGETGYLVEAKPVGAPEFRVVLALDPDVTSVGLITEAAATYRVRAYVFGAASNIAHQTTGD